MKLVPVAKVNIVNLSTACGFLWESGYVAYYLPSPCAVFFFFMYLRLASLVNLRLARMPLLLMLLRPLLSLIVRLYGLVTEKGYWTIYVVVKK